MMKRAFTAVLFGGLLVFAAPQVAFADHDADYYGAEYGGECRAESERSAPGPRYGDCEQHDDDGEFLF
jgi:hypothetical protein